MEKRTPRKQKHWHVYRGRRNTGAVYRNNHRRLRRLRRAADRRTHRRPGRLARVPGRRTARRLKNSPDLVHRALPIPVLIHGVARGADAIEGRWARENNVPVSEVPAQRHLHGFAARVQGTLCFTPGEPHRRGD